MKSPIYIFFLIPMMFFSCKKNENCNNESAVNFFNEHVKIIESQEPGQAIDGKTYLSLFFLETVTDVNSSASYGDISYYEKQDSISKDLLRWKNWLNENKCDLSLDSLIKTEAQVKKVNPWIIVENK